MATLKQLVDETTDIKKDITTCYANLKNNLIDKGVEVKDSDKMIDLVDDVKNLESLPKPVKLLSIKNSPYKRYLLEPKFKGSTLQPLWSLLLVTDKYAYFYNAYYSYIYKCNLINGEESTIGHGKTVNTYSCCGDVENEFIYYFGTWTTSTSNPSNVAEKIDINTGIISQISNTPIRYLYSSNPKVHNNKIYISGSTCYFYDIELDTYTPLSSILSTNKSIWCTSGNYIIAYTGYKFIYYDIDLGISTEISQFSFNTFHHLLLVDGTVFLSYRSTYSSDHNIARFNHLTMSFEPLEGLTVNYDSIVKNTLDSLIERVTPAGDTLIEIK